MQRIFLLLVFSCFLFNPSFSQNIDVEHYQYEISLEDKSDKIAGRATIRIKFLTDVSGFDIDLVSPKEGKGMEAVGVFADGLPVDFTHQDNKLRIIAKAKKGDVRAFDIQYSGVPKDGLIISKNKYGERTFFADNWPNRAHHWIPCNDRPDDKASFEFIVTAPSHYRVI